MSVKPEFWKTLLVSFGQFLLASVAAWILSFGITVILIVSGAVEGYEQALLIFGLTWLIATGVAVRHLQKQ